MLIILVTVINDFSLIEKQIQQNIETFGGVHILRSANCSLCPIMIFNPRTFFLHVRNGVFPYHCQNDIIFTYFFIIGGTSKMQVHIT